MLVVLRPLLDTPGRLVRAHRGDGVQLPAPAYLVKLVHQHLSYDREVRCRPRLRIGAPHGMNDRMCRLTVRLGSKHAEPRTNTTDSNMDTPPVGQASSLSVS